MVHSGYILIVPMQVSREENKRLKASLEFQEARANQAFADMLEARTDRANAEKQLETSEAAWRELQKDSSLKARSIQPQRLDASAGACKELQETLKLKEDLVKKLEKEVQQLQRKSERRRELRQKLVDSQQELQVGHSPVQNCKSCC